MTALQRRVLAALTTGPRTASDIADEWFPDMRAGRFDRIHGRLRLLEDRGLVRRVYLVAPRANVAHWELTHAGRSALNLTG